ncbi:hypothetical protein ABTX61_20895 [Amycolatopsis japonica]|uniref:hypothetical protein n=1 Tax=Amycolatopsis japonica TaxID=208439 RepID=UPI0033179635
MSNNRVTISGDRDRSEVAKVAFATSAKAGIDGHPEPGDYVAKATFATSDVPKVAFATPSPRRSA